MAEWDGERRILNRQRTHFGRRTLQDEAKPDFHPDIFPYDEICFPDFSRKSVAFPVRECFPTEIAHGGPQAHTLFSVNRAGDAAFKSG